MHGLGSKPHKINCNNNFVQQPVDEVHGKVSGGKDTMHTQAGIKTYPCPSLWGSAPAQGPLTPYPTSTSSPPVGTSPPWMSSCLPLLAFWTSCLEGSKSLRLYFYYYHYYYYGTFTLSLIFSFLQLPKVINLGAGCFTFSKSNM